MATGHSSPRDPRASGPAARPGPEGTPRDWFTQPPYPGVWASAGLVLLLAGLLIVISIRPRQAQQVASARYETGTAANAPAPTTVYVPTPGPQRLPDEEPSVSVRSLPPRPAPKNAPAANGPALNAPMGNSPAGNAPLGNSPLPSTPGTLPFPADPELPGQPLPTTPAPPPIEVPQELPQERPQPAPVPAPIPSPAPERPVAPPPRFRPSSPPVRVEQPRGRTTIYFDADSSTFDRGDRRLPLRVEVYVNGVKRLETSDPEKREFDLGRLPEGPHEVVIVPYVGRAEPEPRRKTVFIEAGRRNEFKAVLHRSRGAGQVSKFQERD